LSPPLDPSQTASSVVSQEPPVFDLSTVADSQIQSKKSHSSSLSESRSPYAVQVQEKLLLLSKEASGIKNEQNVNMSDSSDDDENHLIFFRKGRLQIDNRNEEKSDPMILKNNQASLDSRVGITSRKPQEESKFLPRNEEKMNTRNLTRTTRRIHNSKDNDDSSSSDEDLLQSFKDHLKSKGIEGCKRGPGDTDEQICAKLPVLEVNLKDQIYDVPTCNEENSKHTTTEKRSPVRNPLAKMKEIDLSFKEFDAHNMSPHHQSEETKLWSDSDISLAKSEEKVKRKRSKPDKESDTQKSKKSGRSKEMQHTTDGEEHEIAANNVTSCFACLDDDDEIIEHEIKPTFTNPKFGPFECIPLLLTVQTSVVDNGMPTLDHFEVPASINRYLKEYQRDGIRFVFEKAITNRNGAILGDGKSFTCHDSLRCMLMY
jgi:hypothetical protein